MFTALSSVITADTFTPIVTGITTYLPFAITAIVAVMAITIPVTWVINFVRSKIR